MLNTYTVLGGLSVARRVIHIDADCFFAAIEMRDQPQFRHRPMAIGGSASGRGVISTCNYPARRFGIRSAMASAYALRLCPGLTILPHRMTLYRSVSQQMMDIFRSYTTSIEPLSLDEAYLDVSDQCATIEQALILARHIRAQVCAQLGITVSAGVAINKFLAKVASDWRKPDGEFAVGEAETETFTEQLPVNLIPGVGRVTAEQLQFMGVVKCDDLLPYTKDQLLERFGRFGERLYWFSRAVDEREVKAERERKSVSVEKTFSSDRVGEHACQMELPELWRRLRQRLEKLEDGYRVRKGFIKIKFADFTQTTIERPGTDWSCKDYADLLGEGLSRGSGRVRLLGLGVRLEPGAQSQTREQMGLFDQ